MQFDFLNPSVIIGMYIKILEPGSASSSLKVDCKGNNNDLTFTQK